MEYHECNECKDITTDINQFKDDSGIWYDKRNDQYHLVVECNRVIINNCPWCGRKLK